MTTMLLHLWLLAASAAAAPDTQPHAAAAHHLRGRAGCTFPGATAPAHTARPPRISGRPGAGRCLGRARAPEANPVDDEA